jgi:hypothetical protein
VLFFKYSKEEIKSCSGHLIVCSRPWKTRCLGVTIAFHISIIALFLFGDDPEIVQG